MIRIWMSVSSKATFDFRIVCKVLANVEETVNHQGPLLLTRINLNHSMDK